MNKKNAYLVGSLGLVLALGCSTAAAQTPGQRLPQTQVDQMGRMQTYRVGPSQLRVLPSPQRRLSATDSTKVLNSKNVVGESHHQLVITGASAEQIQDALRGSVSPSNLQHFKTTGMIILQFANFDQTVEAFDVLTRALPQAQVVLPVEYGKPVPY